MRALGPRAERVYHELRSAILAGTLPTSLKLPAVPALSRRFGVSPVTVRQAILCLDADGLVEQRHGVGTFVRSPAASELQARSATRYLEALLAGDRDTAVRVALDDGIACGLSIPDLYLGVIEPAQRCIGELWQENRITVAHEHIATAISQLVMALAYPRLPRAPANGKRVLIACVEDELHDFGARMVADFFEMDGFGVRYVGANLPTDSLIGMARGDPPDLVVLSVTMALHLDAAREAVLRLRETAGDRLHVGLGGQAFVWASDLPARLGADVHGRTVLETIASAHAALGHAGVA